MTRLLNYCLSLPSCDEHFPCKGQITFNSRHPVVLCTVANGTFCSQLILNILVLMYHFIWQHVVTKYGNCEKYKTQIFCEDIFLSFDEMCYTDNEVGDNKDGYVLIVNIL
jgi:hypothetical protein